MLSNIYVLFSLSPDFQENSSLASIYQIMDIGAGGAMGL